MTPTVRQAIKSTSAFVWSEETFSSERVFWEEARSFGPGGTGQCLP
ncbi:MAG: autoinducer binding domain-containing protein [Acidithiobacillus ferrivorans]